LVAGSQLQHTASSSGGPQAGAAQQPGQQGAQEFEVHVPSNIQLVWDKHQALDPNSDFLLMAAVANQPSWDAVLVLKGKVYVLRMTVSSSHPVLMQPVASLLERFKPQPAESYLCFVLPSEQYPTFEWQRWRNSKNEPARKDYTVKEVAQVAMLITDTQLKQRTSEDGAPATTAAGSAMPTSFP
jgi:hypothetical protein